MDRRYVIKEIRGLTLRLGGEEHQGWLPPGAAQPLSTPIREVLLDVRIEGDGHSYLLICESRDTEDYWDTWHETFEEAEEQAESWLGIRASDWQNPHD